MPGFDSLFGGDVISSVANLGGKLIDRLFPDPAAAQAAKLKLFEMTQTGELAQLAAETDIIKAGAAIVKSEAESGSWLTRSWRPITMLIFVGLITARWFGWAAPNLAEAEYLELWAIVKIGLGGYVIGRSVEKTAPSIAAAISGNNGK
jgi:hypothetical protein